MTSSRCVFLLFVIFFFRAYFYLLLFMRGVLFDCLLNECGCAIVHELLGFFIFTLCYFVGSPERAS